MSDKIQEALKRLDPDNDNHWTMNGDAKLDTVKFLSGVSVTREELEQIAPGFNRESMRKYVASLKVETTNATVPEPGIGKTDVPEQPKVEERPESREIEINSLAKEIADKNEAINKVKRIQEQAREDLAKLESELNELVDRFNVVNPPPTHQENIRNYLASVRATIEKRANARHALANSGIDIDGLQAQAAPSPIDLSLKSRRR